MIIGNPWQPSDPDNQPQSSGDVVGLSDEGCARLAQEGDDAAMNELVRRYASGIYSLFARIFADREYASDATQEVFLRAHHNLDRFDCKRRFRAWIFTIAWNFARDQFRYRKRREGAKILSLDVYRRQSDGGRTSIEPPDDRARPSDELLESKERALWVREALERLLPSQRALLLLREFEGLSYEELADLVGCKLGTIKSRLHRARMELKEALSALRPGWIDDGMIRDRMIRDGMIRDS